MKRFALLGALTAMLMIGGAGLHAQTPVPDIPKINRYLDLKMYKEAAAVLEPAIKADEFNSELRDLYGVALWGVGNLNDAAENFGLSFRLDASRWQAVDHLFQCYSEKYGKSLATEDRVHLGEAATQLAAFPAGRAKESTSIDDLRKAQLRAEACLIRLNTPEGKWRDERPRLSIRSKPDGTFDIAEEPGASVMFGNFRRIATNEFRGSAHYAKSICVFDIDFTAELQGFGTTLLLTETTAKYDGPDPTGLSAKDLALQLRARDKVCRDLLKNAGPPHSLVLSLERIDEAQHGASAK